MSLSFVLPNSQRRQANHNETFTKHFRRRNREKDIQENQPGSNDIEFIKIGQVLSLS